MAVYGDVFDKIHVLLFHCKKCIIIMLAQCTSERAR